MNPWSRLPSTEHGIPTRHNIHTGLVQPLVSLSSAVPATPIERSPRNVTGPAESATELRQPVASRDPQAAVALGLHALHVFDGEQRVGHELVPVEDRVVVPAHAPESTPAEKSVGDVLRHAALIIEERGWCQGRLVDSTGAVCLSGAIGVAVHGDPRLFTSITMVDAKAIRFLDSCLYDSVGWNDTPGRTVAEVTAALRAAADEADR